MTESPRDESVWPRDCSFLVAIPLDKSSFVRDLEDPDKDFIRGQFADSPLNSEEKWRLYEPTAKAMKGLLKALTTCKARVVTGATLRDWEAAQTDSRVVILFTHWRSGLIRVADVDWNLLPLAHNTTLDQRFEGIAKILSVERSASSADRRAVTEQINQILLSESLGDHPWFGNGRGRLPASVEHRVHANRGFLDQALPGLFHGCTSVEFTSGLVPVETVATSTHSEYNGVFDLSVCTSVMLAEMIKEIAPDCLVAAVDLPAIVDFRVEFYRGVFKMLRGKPFLTTTAELRKAILNDLRGTP